MNNENIVSNLKDIRSSVSYLVDWVATNGKQIGMTDNQIDRFEKYGDVAIQKQNDSIASLEQKAKKSANNSMGL